MKISKQYSNVAGQSCNNHHDRTSSHSEHDEAILTISDENHSVEDKKNDKHSKQSTDFPTTEAQQNEEIPSSPTDSSSTSERMWTDALRSVSTSSCCPVSLDLPCILPMKEDPRINGQSAADSNLAVVVSPGAVSSGSKVDTNKDEHGNIPPSGSKTLPSEAREGSVSSNTSFESDSKGQDDSSSPLQSHPIRLFREPSLRKVKQPREEHPHLCSASSWTNRRIIVAALGCTCSSLVLATRLWFDKEPTAYLIHSVIIFLDMILIHLFTYSPWLSVSGELLTICFFLLFHMTKETVFEFMETTLIAALCSLHMILSRNKHWDNEEHLQEKLHSIRQTSLRELESSLRNLDAPENQNSHGRHSALIAADMGIDTLSSESDVDPVVAVSPYTNDCLRDEETGSFHDEIHRRRPIGEKERDLVQQLPQEHQSWCGCGRVFFEHFLDGSAGVMYTSFIGLIIDELIHLSSEW